MYTDVYIYIHIYIYIAYVDKPISRWWSEWSTTGKAQQQLAAELQSSELRRAAGEEEARQRQTQARRMWHRDDFPGKTWENWWFVGCLMFFFRSFGWFWRVESWNDGLILVGVDLCMPHISSGQKRWIVLFFSLVQVQPLKLASMMFRLCDQGEPHDAVRGLDSRGWELLVALSCTIRAGERHDLQAEEPVQSAGIGEPARQAGSFPIPIQWLWDKGWSTG